MALRLRVSRELNCINLATKKLVNPYERFSQMINSQYFSTKFTQNNPMFMYLSRCPYVIKLFSSELNLTKYD